MTDPTKLTFISHHIPPDSPEYWRWLCKHCPASSYDDGDAGRFPTAFLAHDALTGAYYATATPRDWPDALRALAAARHAAEGDWRLEMAKVHMPRLMVLNPEPLRAVKERSMAAAMDSLRGRSRADQLRTWLAQGGSQQDFDEMYPI